MPDLTFLSLQGPRPAVRGCDPREATGPQLMLALPTSGRTRVADLDRKQLLQLITQAAAALAALDKAADQ